jgi:hypothetical protein
MAGLISDFAWRETRRAKPLLKKKRSERGRKNS